ncbi:hypothetical protein DPMN_161516 [Dreissena polymorpha]|uniref:Uncharacterized protein n=1 Tax=Dreissena polymorpha TaxID=45954 RepID=A0A9D4ISP2_DREPO|nr:hypothetical protein DPMN_161516 [Dreissena polymorpha]
MGSDTVSSFEQLDSFVIEGGSVDILELDTFTDLSVEKLPQLSHKVRFVPWLVLIEHGKSRVGIRR